MGTTCKICKEWYWEKTHNCGTRFEIHCPENGEDEEDSCDRYGWNDEDAAVKWAKSYNEDGEYSLMDSEITIVCKNTETGEISKVCVSAEPDVHYSSTVVE